MLLFAAILFTFSACAAKDGTASVGYIDKLGGDLSQYKNADGRITVK